MSGPAEHRWSLPASPVALAGDAPARGRVLPPSSKSHTNRLLAVASLADGASTLHDPLDSDDSRAMRELARVLGASVADRDPRTWQVDGVAGAPPGGRSADVRQSGTALRFGAALACLAAEPVTVDGAEQLRRRPVGALTTALGALGADVVDAGGYPPVTARGGLRGGAVSVDCAGSSQFASAVLLAAPYAERDVVVCTTGLGAAAYVELTAEVMRAAGASVTEVGGDEPGWQVAAGGGYRPVDVVVEPDASAAAHLLALAAATGGEVTVPGLGAASQPDAALPALLAQMGCEIVRSGHDVTLVGPDCLDAVDADLSATPDQVTTVAALAAIADGTSRLSGVGVARGHETDRIAALAGELSKLGVAVEERPDGLIVHGVGPRPALPDDPVVLAAHDDHRLAMAFAAVAAAVPGVAVGEPWCVAKTYPGFWDAAASLGLAVRELGDVPAAPASEEPR